MANSAPISERSASMLSPTVDIEGITEPVILSYFATLNAGEFRATSETFAEDGVLHPPFEQPVVGRSAIASYLAQEAKGFLLKPQWGETCSLENGCTEFQIVGKVQTPLFSVNVSWLFILSPWKEIFLVKVKLLASPKELLRLRKAQA